MHKSLESWVSWCLEVTQVNGAKYNVIALSRQTTGLQSRSGCREWERERERGEGRGERGKGLPSEWWWRGGEGVLTFSLDLWMSSLYTILSTGETIYWEPTWSHTRVGPTELYSLLSELGCVVMWPIIYLQFTFGCAILCYRGCGSEAMLWGCVPEAVVQRLCSRGCVPEAVG